jgi:L-aspartate oxidase
VRSAASLDGAAKAIEAVAAALGPVPVADADGIELANLVRVGRLMVRSARLREESRGVHWRADAPQRDPAWDGVRLRLTDPD